MFQTAENGAVNTIIEGGATIGVVSFFYGAMRETLPWLTLAVPIIVLDLLYGIRAAKYRGDVVRSSTAIRRTVDKMVGYIMWCAAAVMLAQLFEIDWLDKVVLGLVYGNELISVFGNYLETKGVEISFAGFWKLIFRKGAEKVGVEVSKEDMDDVIKPKGDKQKKEEENG